MEEFQHVYDPAAEVTRDRGVDIWAGQTECGAAKESRVAAPPRSSCVERHRCGKNKILTSLEPAAAHQVK